jgi:hypothetical protein
MTLQIHSDKRAGTIKAAKRLGNGHKEAEMAGHSAS